MRLGSYLSKFIPEEKERKLRVMMEGYKRILIDIGQTAAYLNGAIYLTMHGSPFGIFLFFLLPSPLSDIVKQFFMLHEFDKQEKKKNVFSPSKEKEDEEKEQENLEELAHLLIEESTHDNPFK